MRNSKRGLPKWIVVLETPKNPTKDRAKTKTKKRSGRAAHECREYGGDN